MNKILILCACLITVFSCDNKSHQTEGNDTVGMGNVNITADESLKPVVDALEATFEKLNTAANVNIKYAPEQLTINQMLQDSARVAIVTRELTDQEKQVFVDQKIKYRSLKVGIDGVALIVGNNVKDTLITTTKLKQIMSGIEQGRTIVADNANSSNMTCILSKLDIKNLNNVKIYALNGNKEVIDYVQKNPKAIGIIGVNWISDGDDPASMGFLKSINVMSVSDKANPKPYEYYKPFEYNLYLKNYPFMRNIYMITKEARQGLGTGFINFTASERGQLIIQKTGILPATQPLRLYRVQN